MMAAGLPSTNTRYIRASQSLPSVAGPLRCEASAIWRHRGVVEEAIQARRIADEATQFFATGFARQLSKKGSTASGGTTRQRGSTTHSSGAVTCDGTATRPPTVRVVSVHLHASTSDRRCLAHSRGCEQCLRPAIAGAPSHVPHHAGTSAAATRRRTSTRRSAIITAPPPRSRPNSTKHLVQSIETGEDWKWCYVDRR
jgi:hypothetical protein